MTVFVLEPGRIAPNIFIKYQISGCSCSNSKIPAITKFLPFQGLNLSFRHTFLKLKHRSEAFSGLFLTFLENYNLAETPELNGLNASERILAYQNTTKLFFPLYRYVVISFVKIEGVNDLIRGSDTLIRLFYGFFERVYKLILRIIRDIIINISKWPLEAFYLLISIMFVKCDISGGCRIYEVYTAPQKLQMSNQNYISCKNYKEGR